MNGPLNDDQLMSLGIQLQLLGEGGGTLHPADIARLGTALRHTANQAARMRRSLDEIVADAQEDAALADRRRRGTATINAILAGAMGTITILKQGGQNHG